MAVVRFGVIRGFDKDTYLADVELTGAQSTYIAGVPVALHVRSDMVDDGVGCLVVFHDDMAPGSGVVLALMGGVPPADPAFDPVIGHKHRGMVGDGPELA